MVSWTPSINDWYETVKLNYGFDFTKPDKSVREYPNANTADKPVPDTWRKMDSIIAYWQSIGLDGFRCDMSHMVPPEFWNWAIARARARHPERGLYRRGLRQRPCQGSGSRSGNLATSRREIERYVRPVECRI